MAQLEKRSDLLLSTLRKYVEAMGGDLAVAVKTGAGTVIMLDSLSSLARPSKPRRIGVSKAVRKPVVRCASKPRGKGKGSTKATGTLVA